MDASRGNTVEAAVREALAAQAEDPGLGFGVAFQVDRADCFVQWVRAVDMPASLVVLEVKSGGAGAGPTGAMLTSRGFAPHSSRRLARIGVWEVRDPAAMTWTDEQQLVAALADLVRLLGGRDGQPLKVYP